MLHHTDNTLNKDNPDNWDEADIEDLVQQELAKIAQLPAEELLDNYAPNTAPAINDETVIEPVNHSLLFACLITGQRSQSMHLL
jgi:hypothetical protein